MKNLSTKIKLYANREIDFSKDVRLQDDSNGLGPYIKEWNLDIAQPTEAQLNALETQANDYEYNQGQIQKRQIEYGSPSEQMEFITENGLTAWQTKVTEIKTRFPKR
jgi:hypothetical protein